MWIRDGDSSDPGWKKVQSGTRDKHPGSATLLGSKEKFICCPFSTSFISILAGLELILYSCLFMCWRHMDRLLFSFSVFKWTNTYALSFVSWFARILWVGADGGSSSIRQGSHLGHGFVCGLHLGCLCGLLPPPPCLMISWTPLLSRLWLT
jgi:hypothetical protein